MRSATMADGPELLAWRNDPETIAASRSTSPVDPDDHGRWMKYNVQYGYPQHIVMIADDTEYGALGTVRFDAKPKGDDMTYEVSIALSPKHRGKGMAYDVLRIATGHMAEFTINAQVRTENERSKRVFERCGFDLIARDGAFIKYRRGPLP